MNDYITIGEIIRHYRKGKNLSQEELSNGICDRKHLSHIENDKVIPTLDIINRLSERLQVNLYESYALMLRHHDMDTHKKIELLNQNYKPELLDNLIILVEKYDLLPSFQYGEPKQILLYAKSIYYSNKLHDHRKAISVALEGLSLNKNYYSNTELSLLLMIMVEYCRIGELEEGKKYFELTIDYITHLFSISHFATNRNEQFEIRFLAKVVYNYFIFLKDDNDFNIIYIDKTLELMKSLHSHCMLPELLLCKAYLQTHVGNLTEAKQTYSLAHQLGLYLYTEKYQEHIEKTTLLEYLDTLTEVF